jgi:hypothetical protein
MGNVAACGVIFFLAGKPIKNPNGFGETTTGAQIAKTYSAAGQIIVITGCTNGNALGDFLVGVGDVSTSLSLGIGKETARALACMPKATRPRCLVLANRNAEARIHP